MEVAGDLEHHRVLEALLPESVLVDRPRVLDPNSSATSTSPMTGSTSPPPPPFRSASRAAEQAYAEERSLDLAPSANEPLRGYLLETYVAQNLAAILAAHWPEGRLYYWHVQGRLEVDFVIEDGRDSMAMEIQAATRWSDDDLASLEAFLSTNRRCRAGILVHNGVDAVHLRDRLWALPLALILS